MRAIGMLSLRTIVLYLFVMLSIRIMGKRQIGELRPSELVVTLLISDLAALPISEPGTPLWQGILPIALLAVLEMLISAVMLKLPAVERLVSGTPTAIIRDGVVDAKALKKLRLTMDDLLEGMRIQNYFHIEEIGYALVESNGHITFYPRPAAQPVTCGDMKVQKPDSGMPVPVICDGAYYQWGLQLCNKTEAGVERFLAARKLHREAVFLLTLSADGSFFLLTDDGATAKGRAAF